MTVASADTKNDDPAMIPLRVETAVDLQALFATNSPFAPAFNVPASTKTTEILRADLREVGIPYRVDGKVGDFHSLYHTCGAWLAAANVHPKVIQRIMPHSTITLTMDRYTHLFKGDEATTVAKLPDLGGHDAAEARKTGTDDLEYREKLRGVLRGAYNG